MFISIACGAVSGFHATQSPMMARCITNEKQGRFVFYGAMVMEGIVALIWAAIAMAFFGSIEGLNEVMGKEGRTAAYVVNLISNTLLGRLGAILALLGWLLLPSQAVIPHFVQLVLSLPMLFLFLKRRLKIVY
jgi:carbon starvation protein CstA